MSDSICGLIPVYNNHQTIISAVTSLLTYVEHVIVVNDGSDDGTAELLNILATEDSRIDVIHMSYNQGKGAAVQRGLHYANEQGFSYAIQVDADGQHNLDDVPRFIEVAKRENSALVVGAPLFDENISFGRKHGRKLTDLMMALEMGTLKMPDGNCGFRAYPVRAICAMGKMGNHMDFDPEVLVRAYWAGISIVRVPTKVRYLSEEEGGISHFRMVQDNILHVWMHIRLLPQAPFRLLLRWLKKLTK